MTIIASPEQGTTQADRRAEYTKGLRALADILDANPELPLPYQGQGKYAEAISFHFLHGDDPRASMAAARRALDVPTEKNAPEPGHGEKYFQLNGKLHGLHFSMTAFREQVCERVVVASREVEVSEPDPVAVEALPKVTRTVTVEDVKWVCHSLLDSANGSADVLAEVAV